jgi:hypothetical protein
LPGKTSSLQLPGCHDDDHGAKLEEDALGVEACAAEGSFDDGVFLDVGQSPQS